MLEDLKRLKAQVVRATEDLEDESRFKKTATVKLDHEQVIKFIKFFAR